MKGIVGFTPLYTALKEKDETIILSYEPGTSIVHLGHLGVIGPECGLEFKTSINEVMYFNGGQELENFCPKCFSDYQNLLKRLSDA